MTLEILRSIIGENKHSINVCCEPVTQFHIAKIDLKIPLNPEYLRNPKSMNTILQKLCRAVDSNLKHINYDTFQC